MLNERSTMYMYLTHSLDGLPKVFDFLCHVGGNLSQFELVVFLRPLLLQFSLLVVSNHSPRQLPLTGERKNKTRQKTVHTESAE